MVLLVAACGGGDDDKGYGDPITVDSATKSSITQAVQSAAALRTIEDTPGSDTALANVSGLYGSMNVLMAAKLAATAGQQRLAPVGAILEAAAGKPVTQDCLTVTTGKVTYNNCNYGQGTIDGTISYGSGTFSIDLEISSTTGGSMFSITQRGSLTVTTGAITGDLSIDVEAKFGNVTTTSSFDADYDIVLTNACATDGSLEVHAEGSAQTGQGSGGYDVWVKADFGPACGDVTVY
jgi:hypothetical protein